VKLSSVEERRAPAEVVDGIAWLSINNPAKRNALSVAVVTALDAALRRLDADPEVKVIVLRGAGTGAFAAGADISEFEGQQNSATVRQAADETVAGLFATLDHLGTPLIAMIHGYCLGAGVAVALGADLRVAGEGARFAIPAARLGVGYPVPLTSALVHTVGRAHAADILFTGRRLTSREAVEFGLVNRVVADADLEGEVKEIAEMMAANSPLSIRAAKASIRATTDPDRRPHAEELVGACVASADAMEGQRAFMEKRPARFVGA
jgi:enoyl-CoA hydratase/carnithine racemase